jgi:hypothetical protein
MNLVPSLIHCHCTGPATAIERLTAKHLWIRFNRLLAWVVVISPFVQIALETNLVNGLLLDAGLLLMHCILSLHLFGLPKGAAGERWKLWLGLSPDGLSVRGRFLMTAWRIALGVAWMAAMLSLASAFGPNAFILVFVCLPLWLPQPVFVLGHVFGASNYAFKRWGANVDYAWVSAASLAAMVAFANTINLFR